MIVAIREGREIVDPHRPKADELFVVVVECEFFGVCEGEGGREEKDWGFFVVREVFWWCGFVYCCVGLRF